MSTVDYHHGNLKDVLILTGENEIERVGSEGLSLREIARLAGVSHNAPYRHFRSKDELVDQIIEKSLIELSEQILSAPLFYPASILLQIQYVGRLWALLALRHPHKTNLMFKIFKPHHKNLHISLCTLLEDRVGVDISPKVNVSQLALVLLSTFNGIALLHTNNCDEAFPRKEEAIYSLTDEASSWILHSATQ